MHELIDQYEVEPRSHYSGSYNDVLTYRDMFETSASFKREVIASKVSGITSKLEEKKVLYSFVLNLVSGNLLGSSVNFSQAISQEQFFDSFGPNIVEIFLKNGKTITLYNVAQIDPSRPHKGDSNFNIAPLPASASFYLPYGDSRNFFAGFGELSDNVWPFAFPFEGKYKSIERTLSPSPKLPNPVLVSFGVGGNPPSPVPVDVLGGIVLYPSRSADSITISPIHYVLDLPLAPSNSLSSIIPGGNESSGSGATIKLNQATRSGFDTVLKTIFGTGEGPILHTGVVTTDGGTVRSMKNKFPSFKDFFDASATNPLGGGGVYLFGPSLRGTKYGMINPLPLNTKCIYRLGRYGQFRDMLEQRAFSKLYSVDIITGRRTVADGVVTIRFKSGTTIASASNAELSTTNSSTGFNPKDSGQFNSEYRSGQPFFDDVNLELYRNF